jgi:1-acyl-sn-glycerol-3-phosphate acyltransferase
MKQLWYAFAKLVCWLAFRIGFGLQVQGQAHVPRHGAFLLASNHLSFLDPPLVGAACPRRLWFLARDDLFEHPLLGTLLRMLDVMPLKRGESDVATIRLALHHLKRGHPVAMFPEGGRQLSGAIGASKRGIGLLAAWARVPIVPVVVQGTFDALPPTASRPRPAKIRVAFGPPIPYTNGSEPMPNNHQASARQRRHQALADAVTEQWRRLADTIRL